MNKIKVFHLVILFPLFLISAITPKLILANDGFSISGTTFYREAGRKIPIEGMTVILYRDAERIQQISTDRNGRFVFNNVAPGTYNIFTPTAYPYLYTRLANDYYDRDERVEIEIPRRRMLIIRTIDKYTKKPLPGVPLTICDNISGVRIWGARTNDNGLRRLWDMPKGEYRIEIGGFRYDKLEPVVIQLEEYTELEFEVEKFITISGTVTTVLDGEIAPAPEQFVRLRKDPVWKQIQLEELSPSIDIAWTDENGRFEIELSQRLQPGTYYLTVAYNKLEDKTIWDRKFGGYNKITVEGGKDVRDVELTIQLPKPTVLKGTVINPDGDPAAGANIVGRRYADVIEGIGIDGFSIYADDTGRFGPYEVLPGLFTLAANYELKPKSQSRYTSNLMQLELLPGEVKELDISLRESSYTYQQLGRYYYTTNDIPSAIEAFEKSIEMKQDAGVSYYYLALIAIEQNDIDKAERIREDIMGRIDETNVNYKYYLELFRNVSEYADRSIKDRAR